MKIIGVHPVGKNIFLIEALVPGPYVDWLGITQPVDGQPKDLWQVPWDERQLGDDRWAFFFHYLDLDKPFRTPFGDIWFPSPTPLPEHLADIKYESPC